MNRLNYIKETFFCIENAQGARDRWLIKQLSNLPNNSKLLDAGCGNQPYKQHCEHLEYLTQDFGQYDGEGSGEGMQYGEEWHYGKLDYIGDIWNIDEKDNTFDAVLCSEVFEHIPYPSQTFGELARLLKKGGKLIITAPYACLPHMQPYFHYSGFSDEFYKYHCEKHGLELVEIDVNNNMFGFLFQELKRASTLIKSTPVKLLYYAMFCCVAPFIKLLMKTYKGESPIHLGYHIVAIKK